MRHSASRIGRDSRHVHSTEGCVCGSMFNMVARAHMHQLSAWQQQSSSQRVGALLIHRPAWVDQHTSGSGLTPTVHRCPKGMAVGGPCDRRHSTQCRNTPNIFSLVFFPLSFFPLSFFFPSRFFFLSFPPLPLLSFPPLLSFFPPLSFTPPPLLSFFFHPLVPPPSAIVFLSSPSFFSLSYENRDDQCSVKCPIPGDGYRQKSGV